MTDTFVWIVVLCFIGTGAIFSFIELLLAYVNWRVEVRQQKIELAAHKRRVTHFYSRGHRGQI